MPPSNKTQSRLPWRGQIPYRQLHFSRSAKIQSLPLILQLLKIVSNATVCLIRSPFTARFDAFPIAAKTPILAATLLLRMKLPALFRFARSAPGQQAGLGSPCDAPLQLDLPVQSPLSQSALTMLLEIARRACPAQTDAHSLKPKWLCS
jgi:hypothetical protein